MSVPTLVTLGGPPGSGKSTAARRLSCDLGWPVLSSDTIGRLIRDSNGAREATSDPFFIAYDVVFGLADDFIDVGVSVILDLNMGWEFQWRELDRLKERHPALLYLPIVLRCPYRVCLERIAERHRADPTRRSAPEWFADDRAAQGVWDFLDQLDRPDIAFIDASRAEDDV